MICRGYDIDQMLNAAVRSVSAFGTSDLVTHEEAVSELPRSTVKTAEFIRSLKRYVAGDDSTIKARFDKKFKPSKSLPDLTIDYAVGPWVVQVTSLPATEKQASHTQLESQSKLFEIEVLRGEFDGNNISPVLLINEDVLSQSPSEQAVENASRMMERLIQLAKSRDVEVMTAATPEQAASLVKALT